MSKIIQDVESQRNKAEALKDISDALKTGLNRKTASIVALNMIKYSQASLKKILKSILVKS
jgi:hypothetical protein